MVNKSDYPLCHLTSWGSQSCDFLSFLLGSCWVLKTRYLCLGMLVSSEQREPRVMITKKMTSFFLLLGRIGWEFRSSPTSSAGVPNPARKEWDILILWPELEVFVCVRCWHIFLCAGDVTGMYCITTWCSATHCFVWTYVNKTKKNVMYFRGPHYGETKMTCKRTFQNFSD